MAIAKRLDQMGIKPRLSRVWQPNSVRVILTNETYAGRTYYAKTQILRRWADKSLAQKMNGFHLYSPPSID